MFKKDNFWLGVLYALLVPGVLMAILYFSLKSQGRSINPSTLENMLLFLIAANAVVMNFGFLQREKDLTGKGMFITTGVFAFAYIVYYYIL